MRFPEEIEDDLLAHRNIDIGLWHQLTINPLTGGPYLSSRRLLVIIEGLPEGGRYKTAARGGRQTRAERVAEEHYNETARLRLSYHVVNGGADASYEPIFCVDPIDEIEAARLDAEDEQYQAQAIADFESEIGFS